MKLGTSLRFLFPTSPATHERFRGLPASMPKGAFIERPMGAYSADEQARNLNLLLYHGVLAPRARWRSHVVRYGRPAPDSLTLELEDRPRAAHPTPTWTWAALMRRVFDLDVLACPRCPGLSPLWRPAACYRHRPGPRGGARHPRPPRVGPGPRPPRPGPALARAHRGHRVTLRRPRRALRGLPDPRRRPPTAATAALRPAHTPLDDVPIA
jgi:hypothetical protein